ncbi:MAG: hypothetical protein P8Q36_00970 [Alphaproteobacteria bacterium]|jgi:uncharacterized membrane protein YhaH (DUF805 family)|nr:hypothetical protein [Rhodospirillaceae bacterium]MBT6204780.1 hypothetical protein [Rhodospirillaceae bacterium]MBT6510192.1 hypothetical protein [Rhodospirillaceae bacterium]MBT7613320.1 hypothetical protein [Rhodospirillaceae bacterium]MDG2479427.1 hypothetical protein [Alphaproteobacteria bacterium]
MLVENSPIPVLAVFAALFAVSSLAGATQPLPRRPYAWRIIVAALVVAGVDIATDDTEFSRWYERVFGRGIGRILLEYHLYWVTYLVDLAAAFALVRWVGRRFVDIRRSRWWALLCLVPLINLAVVLWLFVAVTQNDPLEDA